MIFVDYPSCIIVEIAKRFAHTHNRIYDERVCNCGMRLMDDFVSDTSPLCVRVCVRVVR